MGSKVIGPSKLSTALRLSLILILLLCLCSNGWSQVVHENPGTATPSRGQGIDDQMASLLESMLANLGDISAAVDGGNFTSARASYSKFYSSYAKYNDLMWQLNLSEADYKAIVDQMNLTNDQVRSIIDDAEVYITSTGEYDNAISGNDSLNASIYAARARESYANISSSYGGLRYNATLLGRVLGSGGSGNSANASSSGGGFMYNSSITGPIFADIGIDTGGLDNSINSLDQLMIHYNRTYSNLSSAPNGPTLSLSAGRSNLSVGDEVLFHAALKDANGTPMDGDKLMVYVGADLVSFSMTGTGGEGWIRYTIPINVSGDHIMAHAEYLPPSGPLVLSNYINLYIQNLPATVTLDLDKNSASFGDTVNITGEITAGGKPMPNRPIEISFNGSAIATVCTDKNGLYAYSLPIGPTTPAELLIVNATYHRKPNDLLLNASSPDKLLGVYARAANITMDALPALSQGGAASITGSLAVVNGPPVAGANVSAYIDGIEMGRGMTDASGNYSIVAIVPRNISSGDHNIYTGFNPGAVKALMESSSAPVVVSFKDSGQKLRASGVPLAVFPGDRLDLSGTLQTGNGLPIPDKALNVSMLGAGETTIKTGMLGDFNESYTARGNESAGWHSVKVVDPETGNVLYEASVMLIPFDKSIVVGALLLVIVAGIAVLLYIRYTSRKPEKPAESVEMPLAAPVEPAVIQEKVAFNVEGEIAAIRASVEGQDMPAAATQVYIASRKLLASLGMKLDDSMTHNEFYRAASAEFPEGSQPLKFIVGVYEKAAFAGRQLEAGEMDQAINCLKEAAARLKPAEGAL